MPWLISRQQRTNFLNLRKSFPSMGLVTQSRLKLNEELLHLRMKLPSDGQVSRLYSWPCKFIRFWFSSSDPRQCRHPCFLLISSIQYKSSWNQDFFWYKWELWRYLLTCESFWSIWRISRNNLPYYLCSNFCTSFSGCLIALVLCSAGPYDLWSTPSKCSLNWCCDITMKSLV